MDSTLKNGEIWWYVSNISKSLLRIVLNMARLHSSNWLFARCQESFLAAEYLVHFRLSISDISPSETHLDYKLDHISNVIREITHEG